MTLDSNQPVEWDGQVLAGWIAINGVLIKVQAGREIIHQRARGFNDAVTWEIDRHRAEIFRRLIPFFTEKESQKRKVGIPLELLVAGCLRPSMALSQPISRVSTAPLTHRPL